MRRVDAILMASGFSHRFGRDNKLLWKFQNKPLAVYTLELACALPFHAIHFVAADPAVLALARPYPVRRHKNTRPARGKCESIRLGVLASDADFYMFFPCDQPLLDAETVLALLEKAAPGKIVFPFFDDTPSSPVLFSSVFRGELLALQDGEGGRAVKDRHPEALVPVPIKTGRPLTDIDTAYDRKLL